MNFREAYERGQAGANKGISMGEDLKVVSSAINNLQRAMIYVVAAAAKGKIIFSLKNFLVKVN